MTAELIYQVEHANDVERHTASNTRRKAILALWQHSAGAPGRLLQIGTREGWTGLLRSRNSPWMDRFVGQPRRTADEGTSKAEACLTLASHLQVVTEPLIRAALHIAAQTADPGVKEEAALAALAKVESAETKVTRILLNWSDKASSRKEEMRADIQKSVATFNECTDLLLRALGQLSAAEGASDDQTETPDSAGT